jgi:hypothetical protein
MQRGELSDSRNRQAAGNQGGQNEDQIWQRSSRGTDVHVNTAGLPAVHAPAAMGLSGHLEFDSSNHGLC